MIYCRLDMASGPKSRVPFGSAGFSIIGGQVNSPTEKTLGLTSHKISRNGKKGNFPHWALCKLAKGAYFCVPFNTQTMAVTRLKRKGRKDKSKSHVRNVTLKIQNFKPVIRGVDVEKIKEEFKAKAK